MKAVLFCGGVGTRMWPMSRKKTPKQFELLIGDKSIFEQTLERVLQGFEPEDVFVSTGSEYKDFIIKQAPQIPLRNIILEPERRDSLGAVGYATAYVDKMYPGSVMAAIWGADHLVEDGEAFLKSIKVAGHLAGTKSVIAKVDVRPTFPSTYNGWVEIGEQIDIVDGLEVYEFVRFVEKPDEKTAKKLFKSFKHLINTGYMAWKTTTVLDFYKKHQPEMFDQLKEIADSIGTTQEQEKLSEIYPKLEKDSVDYGIFEHLTPEDMVVIPSDIGWTDVGTWGLLHAGLGENESSNVTQGEATVYGGEGNLVWSTQGKTIAVVGLDDIVVVDSKDAILVCNRSRTGDVKNLLEQFKKERPELI